MGIDIFIASECGHMLAYDNKHSDGGTLPSDFCQTCHRVLSDYGMLGAEKVRRLWQLDEQRVPLWERHTR